MELLMTCCAPREPNVTLQKPWPHGPFQQPENSRRNELTREEERIVKRTGEVPQQGARAPAGQASEIEVSKVIGEE